MQLNKIYLGDAYNLIKQIPDKSIDLIVTDPPYEINSLTGGGMLKEKRIENLMDSLENENLHIGIKEDILNEFIRVCKKINIYIWCNKTLIPKLLDFFVIKHKCTFDIITWHKTNAMPLCGGKYLTDTEYCLYFKDGVKLNTTYDTAKTHYELPINIQDKVLYSHPTIKPIQIIKNLITNSSLEGGVILDTFMGSGTTAVACKELNRQYIGFELNPKFYEIANDRLNDVTQVDKKKEEQGYMRLF